ncbi:MAG: hypothetical protein U9O97_05040, partial [Elusimicrobiota bacterium]|nr:hypothetical protein [Elusimicrobiota bacterium]
YHIFGIRDVSDIPSWKELGGDEDTERDEDVLTEESGDDVIDSDIDEMDEADENEDGEETEI